MEKYAIGIDLGGTNLKGVVMDRNGKTRSISRIPTEAEKGGAAVFAILSVLSKNFSDRKKIALRYHASVSARRGL